MRRAQPQDVSAIADLLSRLGYPADPALVDAPAMAGDADCDLIAEGALIVVHRISMRAEGGGPGADHRLGRCPQAA